MKKFLFVYRSPSDLPEMSAEEMQADMESWIGWVGSAMQAGWMTDAGEALLPDSAAVVRKDTVSDGPFIESKELVGGFSIITATDLAAAQDYAKTCPGVLSGGSVEIRELMDIPQ